MTLTDDSLYRALESTQRRRLLHILVESDEPSLSVDEVASLLSGWEATDTNAAVSPDEYERTRIALTHVHLPLLADLGMIEYDSSKGTVSVAAVDPAVTSVITRSVEGGHSLQQ